MMPFEPCRHRRRPVTQPQLAGAGFYDNSFFLVEGATFPCKKAPLSHYRPHIAHIEHHRKCPQSEDQEAPDRRAAGWLSFVIRRPLLGPFTLHSLVRLSYWSACSYSWGFGHPLAVSNGQVGCPFEEKAIVLVCRRPVRIFSEQQKHRAVSVINRSFRGRVAATQR